MKLFSLRYRSLYWRGAMAFVVIVVGVVASQAALSEWLMRREMAARGDRLKHTLAVAVDLGGALASDPNLDLAAYLHEADSSNRLFAIMRDGRVVGRLPPPNIVELVRSGLKDRDRPTIPSSWRRSGYSAAGVIIDGQLVGVLGFVRPTVFETNGVLLSSIGFAVLVAGALLTAVLLFGPTLRRLRDLEQAARRLERGDLSARAREKGNDEVGELARAFNSMADGLSQHARDEELSTRARRQLLADVSHELMTPLTAIRGYLETLAMTGIQMDVFTRQKHVATARRETQRLERLIGDLLDTARFEAGGGELEEADIRVLDLFERVADHHGPECQARDISCDIVIEPGAESIVGDPFRLEQALLNVSANALRHTPNGGRIALLARPQHGAIELSVTDSGEGIPAEHLPLIFNRFHKVPASDRSHPSTGSGLGLSIVKAIVERHGGSVSARSTLRQGTTISLLLPLRQIAAPGLHAQAR